MKPSFIVTDKPINSKINGQLFYLWDKYMYMYVFLSNPNMEKLLATIKNFINIETNPQHLHVWITWW